MPWPATISCSTRSHDGLREAVPCPPRRPWQTLPGICLTVSGVPSGPQKEMAALLTAGPEASSPDPPPRCTKASAAAPRRAPSTCWCPRPRSVTAPASRGCSGPSGCPPGPRESGTVPTLNSRPHGTQGVGRVKSKHVNQHIDMHIGNFLYSQKRSYQCPVPDKSACCQLTRPIRCSRHRSWPGSPGGGVRDQVPASKKRDAMPLASKGRRTCWNDTASRSTTVANPVLRFSRP